MLDHDLGRLPFNSSQVFLADQDSYGGSLPVPPACNDNPPMDAASCAIGRLITVDDLHGARHYEGNLRSSI